jgi:hypothetical protein
MHQLLTHCCRYKEAASGVVTVSCHNLTLLQLC